MGTWTGKGTWTEKGTWTSCILAQDTWTEKGTWTEKDTQTECLHLDISCHLDRHFRTLGQKKDTWTEKDTWQRCLTACGRLDSAKCPCPSHYPVQVNPVQVVAHVQVNRYP